MRWLNFWPCWVLLICGCATLILPNVPFYEVGMPSRYELGGMALVVLYLSFGFGSLGLYGLVMAGLGWKLSPPNPKTFKIGLAAISLAAALVWCYLTLMDFTLAL